ncbi:hypothetical protein KFK09_017619 [Dendrobium nobile]|uniref:Uncharacterized protein n=1 Tax=Dendrobium nobile TaxID=94219 RepID=A0A8T3B1R9_DENNO|nr:hypothetical protein KFK09_017619 [Dendrobium nobile]
MCRILQEMTIFFSDRRNPLAALSNGIGCLYSRWQSVYSSTGFFVTVLALRSFTEAKKVMSKHVEGKGIIHPLGCVMNILLSFLLL